MATIKEWIQYIPNVLQCVSDIVFFKKIRLPRFQLLTLCLVENMLPEAEFKLVCSNRTIVHLLIETLDKWDGNFLAFFNGS